jgi:hypothetical protein
MTLIGLFLAFKGQDVTVNVSEIAIGGTWAGCIGFGFGSIFSKRAFRKNALIAYWCVTMALVGAFFGPIISSASFATQLLFGAAAGAILGLILALLHWRQLNNKPGRAPSLAT